MSQEFWKRSPLTGQKYDYFSKDILHIVNLSQVDFYMNECDLVPIDVMLSDDRKRPGKKIVLFLFSKEETKDAYTAWCEREHDTEGGANE